MAAARLFSPLDPAFTDGDWVQDFQFYAGDLDTPETGWTGASLTLVKKGSPAASYSFSNSDNGGLQIVDTGRIGIRIAAATMAGLTPGDYAFALRRLGDDNATDVALTGTVSILQGLSQIVGSPTSAILAGAGDSSGTIMVVRSASLVEVIRSGIGPMGPQGPVGPGVANTVTYDDTVTALGATNVQDAIAKLLQLIHAGGESSIVGTESGDELGTESGDPLA